MAKKQTKLDKMSKKERTSLAYALATNLAKHGKPQTPKNERKLTKGEMQKKEKNVMKFKKAFDLEEAQNITKAIKEMFTEQNCGCGKNPCETYGNINEKELKNPKKADLNKDGKLSSYEKKRGAAIEKAMQKEGELQLVHVYDKDGKMYGTGSVEKVEGDKTVVRFDGSTVKRFPSDRVKPVKEAVSKAIQKEGELEEGLLSKLAGGLAVIASLIAVGQINSSDEQIKALKAEYEQAQTDAEKEAIKDKIEARLIYLDTGKSQMDEDLDLGHQDDEPHMLKKDLYRIAKYASELYIMVDEFDNEGTEVDFPHWWQSKVIKAKEMLISAKHYLDGELTIPQIDMTIGENDKDEHKVLSPSELDRLAALPPTDPSFKKDRRHKRLMKKKNAKV